MADGSRKKGRPKRRVDFRRNRQRPGRRKQWANPQADDIATHDAVQHESVRAKGDLSRKRTVTDRTPTHGEHAGLIDGIVTAVRGQFFEVYDGHRRWLCTARRVLRMRMIGDRSPIAAGDRVAFAKSAQAGRAEEGVIEHLYPRRTLLQCSDGRRTHTIAANVDQAMIVASVFEPRLKPHLLDRYLVAAHAGSLPAVICITKTDLDDEGFAAEYLELYRSIGYQALGASTVTGEGMIELRSVLKDKATLLAGQSGVGKSSLLNVLQPSLARATAEVSEATEKGRHTTTTAEWLPLDFGGAVVDTPGIRALDVAMVPLQELEMHFVEFIDLIPLCKFPDCVHIHEAGCAIKAALEEGRIDAQRYESYVTLFRERSEAR